MERVELKQYGTEIHLYIDDKFCAALRVGSMTITSYGMPGDPTTKQVPAVRASSRQINYGPTGPAEDEMILECPLVFVDEPRGARAETIAWREAMVADLETIIGPYRHHYQPMYSPGGSDAQEVARLATAMHESAIAFGGHFATFFEVLCAWMLSRVVGDAKMLPSEGSTLAPGEPPPGVDP